MELALVKLYRVTGKQLYLDMARKFLEIRGVTYVPDGEGVMSPTYAQQHAPVTEQKEAVGHAVRATYLYSAMADVGTLTGEPAYGKALDRIWGNITNTRMHITGGLGAVHGIEGFGPQYELPNADAFNETCAAVGNVLFNYRMFLLHKDAKYLDVAEVALLNNVLAAVNLEGNRFFYVNPLEADGKYPFNHGTAGRAPWFGTACCPSNMARLVPQVPGMTYAHDDNDLYITFLAESRTEIDTRGCARSSCSRRPLIRTMAKSAWSSIRRSRRSSACYFGFRRGRAIASSPANSIATSTRPQSSESHCERPESSARSRQWFCRHRPPVESRRSRAVDAADAHSRQ